MLINSGVMISVYGATRAISYLCTRPTPQDQRFAQFRTACANAHDFARTFGTPSGWDLASIIWKNLWISAYALSVLVTFSSVPIVFSLRFVGECTVFAIGFASLAGILPLAFRRMFA
jgi:hypothetical protein